MFPIDIQRNRSLIRRGKLQLFVFKKNPDAHHGALDNIKCKKAHWNVLTKAEKNCWAPRQYVFRIFLPFGTASTVLKQVSLLLEVASNTLSKFPTCD